MTYDILITLRDYTEQLVCRIEGEEEAIEVAKNWYKDHQEQAIRVICRKTQEIFFNED